MKSFCLYLFALICISSCYTPSYRLRQGNYDKAMQGYAYKLRHQSPKHKKLRDLKGLEASFAAAQHQDSMALAVLQTEANTENWPQINAIHRRIQLRQNELAKLFPLRSRSAYTPRFQTVAAIDSIEGDSRRRAAAFLYAEAQELLALTDSFGQRQPARLAYYTLRDLKTNYFPYWENANALLDSAHEAGKAHILFETSVENGVEDGNDFWKSSSLKRNFIKDEWLVFYTDPGARPSFDYLAKCRLVALNIGSESSSSSDRIETKEVEDGYDETLDSAGHVISRTVKYKTETKIITTYSSSRSGFATVLLELQDEHTGEVIYTESLQGAHSFSESSELWTPSAPSFGTMINYIESSVESSLHRVLKKVLNPPGQR